MPVLAAVSMSRSAILAVERDLKASFKGDTDIDVDGEVEVDIDKEAFKVSSGTIKWCTSNYGTDFDNPETASPVCWVMGFILGPIYHLKSILNVSLLSRILTVAHMGVSKIRGPKNGAQEIRFLFEGHPPTGPPIS